MHHFLLSFSMGWSNWEKFSSVSGDISSSWLGSSFLSSSSLLPFFSSFLPSFPHPSLSVLTFLALKSALSECKYLLLLSFDWKEWYIFPHPFIFNPSVSLHLKQVSFGQHRGRPCFLTYSVSLWLLIGVVTPLMFKGIIGSVD